MRRRGTLLISDIVFIVLALAFITILIVFIARQSSSTSVIEEQYAKQIALALDAAEPGMQIHLRISELLDAKKPEFIGNVIRIDDGRREVRVQLSSESGFSYGFFNGASITYALQGDFLEIGVSAGGAR